MSNVRLRSAVAVLVTAAAGGLVTLAGGVPASAAACSGTSGVTVVVEYGELGGGIDVGCAPEGGGRTAAKVFEDAGHPLTFLQRFPSFVCRVDGVPADDPCVNTPPADAYWGLWWSDGESGEWSYSSLAAGSLTVPAGGLRRDGLGRLLGRRTPPDRRAGASDAHAHADAHPDEEALADPPPRLRVPPQR